MSEKKERTENGSKREKKSVPVSPPLPPSIASSTHRPSICAPFFFFLLGLLSRGDLDVLGLLCEDELDVAGVAHVGCNDD